MLVLAITSFVAFHQEQMYAVQAGHQIEMPDGADWLRAGFVVPVIVERAPETAAVMPAENAAMPKAKTKRRS